MRFKEKYTKEDVCKWIERYNKTKSVKIVAKEFGVSDACVWKRLKKEGIKLSNRKHSFDDDFFSRGTPESFYWAGFIAADGCVSISKSSRYLTIGLSTKDLSHLEKFKTDIGYSGKISVNTNKKGCSISICSEKIFNDLSKFNIVPRKSLILKFPENIHGSDVVHFMRGYFDGDGSFYKSKSKIRTKLAFSVCGTKLFLEEFRNILSQGCDINPNVKIRKTRNIYCLEYCGNNNVKKIRDFLYNDKKLCLDRKRDIVFNDWIDKKFKSLLCKPITATNENETITFESLSDAHRRGFDKSCIYDSMKSTTYKYKGYTWKYLES